MKQPKKRVCLSLSPELYAILEELARQRSRTVPNYILHFLRALFEI